MTSIPFPRSRLTLLVLTAVLGAAMPARADDDAVAGLMKALTDYSTLLKACPHYKDLAEVRSCQEAAIPGAGTACPPLQAVEVADPKPGNCDAVIWDELAASVNAVAKARLTTAARSGYSAGLHVAITPRSSAANHLHDAKYAPAGTCAEKWIQRKDRVDGFWAVYKESSMSVSLPVPTNSTLVVEFLAEARRKQGAGASVGGTFCGWENHGPGDRTCKPVSEDPPHSGRACTGHADCRGLPCGEWICEQRVCRQVEAFPDGTPCANGGTCKAGECVREF